MISCVQGSLPDYVGRLLCCYQIRVSRSLSPILLSPLLLTNSYLSYLRCTPVLIAYSYSIASYQVTVVTCAYGMLDTYNFHCTINQAHVNYTPLLVGTVHFFFFWYSILAYGGAMARPGQSTRIKYPYRLSPMLNGLSLTK